MTANWQEIQQGLSQQFENVSWKPQVTTKGRNKEEIIKNGTRVAGCVAHIDARDVMQRLDAVVGAGNWSDSYQVLQDGKHVECTITIYGVPKSDVGQSNDGGFADPVKSAYSDAFKRAAVKWGIGRHLYDMEMQWLPFDGYKVATPDPPKSSGPAIKVPPANPTPQQTGQNGFNLGDEVVVAGEHDEKLGTVAGFDRALIVVRVDGKPFSVKPERLTIVTPESEQPELFPAEPSVGADSVGAYSE